MKYDIASIEKLEKEKGLVSLYTIRRNGYHLVRKVKKLAREHIIELDISTVSGLRRTMQFLSIDLFNQAVAQNKRIKKDFKGVRRIMGRPYAFCTGCKCKDTCTEEIPCKAREDYRRAKEFAEKVKEDDRFWKNGVPKKSLMLCESSKYRYAHKKSAGNCQGSTCRFYEKGGCILGIDKDKEVCYNLSTKKISLSYPKGI